MLHVHELLYFGGLQLLVFIIINVDIRTIQHYFYN